MKDAAGRAEARPEEAGLLPGKPRQRRLPGRGQWRFRHRKEHVVENHAGGAGGAAGGCRVHADPAPNEDRSRLLEQRLQQHEAIVLAGPAAGLASAGDQPVHRQPRAEHGLGLGAPAHLDQERDVIPSGEARGHALAHGETVAEDQPGSPRRSGFEQREERFELPSRAAEPALLPHVQLRQQTRPPCRDARELGLAAAGHVDDADRPRTRRRKGQGVVPEAAR
ncbi:MAG: hypothetical protein GWN84_00740 [Gammaproteobacteria bacterium]|nr:hypothetical protein [Gammaproteobacteria bacterium]NIR81725.1 hypothetical protein [Gammaproteobacteria bacterium]NIR88528.1 hypothetical protein [Gammaproteobacteria bacterium]NIU02832.1 hypothetical protein [Gammaproteobacteria bacterium]NIV50354.1 hypothetical protein [Gammaproteobacteria bacterium]